MKYILIILLVASPFTDLDKIAKVNKLKKEAKAAFNEGEYEKALAHYHTLVDSMSIDDDNIILNMANAYYKLSDSTNALNNYQSILDSKDKTIKSVAHQQLGIMADRSKKFEQALDHFKQALRANPKNEEARYNYEMLKKMLDEKEKNQQDQQNKDNKDENKQDQEQKQDEQQNKENEDQQKNEQEKQDQKNKDGESKEDQQKDGEKSEEEKQKEQQEKNKKGEEEQKDQKQPQEGEQSDEKKGKEEQMSNFSDKLKEMKISEEKAKMILEAMKNNEIQYYQQSKKKATKRPDPDKPDW